MAVTDQTPYQSYTGNGATVSFAYPFKIMKESDLVVTVDGVTQTLTTHYTLSGVGSAGGGNVTFVAAPTNGSSVVIYRYVPTTRDTDYQDNGDLLASTLNDDIDRVVMMMQDNAVSVDSTLGVPLGEATTNRLTETAAERAGKVAGFDSSGNFAVLNAADIGAVVVGDGLSLAGATVSVDSTVTRNNSNQTFTKAQRGSITALTDAANIATDMSLNNFFSVTLAGNRTLDNPSNIVAGQSGSIFITQDGTGNRTLAYGSYWDFDGGMAPTLSAAAGAIDRLDYVVRSATSIHAKLSLDVK